MKTLKNIAMAIAMTIIGTASTYANNTVAKNHSHMPVAVAVAHNNHHHHDMHNHRHLNKPMHNCFCKHCKKMRHQMEKARRRHEAKMRKMEAHRHHHREVNARNGHHAYAGRH